MQTFSVSLRLVFSFSWLLNLLIIVISNSQSDDNPNIPVVSKSGSDACLVSLNCGGVLPFSNAL